MPTLSRTHRGHSAGYCGAFTCTEDWQLTDRQQGYILQEVTRRLDGLILYSDGLELPLTPVQAQGAFTPMPQPLYLDVTRYWELFAVPANGPIHGDQFQSNWFAPSKQGQPTAVTRGTFTIAGTAKFYATTATPAQLGFNRPYLPISAGLPSTTIDPTRHFAGLAPASAPVVRRVVATWDSRKLDIATQSMGKTVLTIA